MKSNEMDNFEKLLNKAYNFLSFRPRSEKEIKDYLTKKVKSESQSEKIIDSVILKLKEQRFLDDKEFVRWWVEQRSKVKPKSMRFIKMELKQKGIAKELTEEVLEDEDFKTVSDYNKALVLAKKRFKRYGNEEPKKAWEKMARFLASKGFDYDVIKEVIDRVLPKEYNK